MVIIFDLDNTLYDEITFVRSGFNAVAKLLAKEIELSRKDILEEMLLLLNQRGRGKTFDEILIRYNIHSKRNVRKCLSAYRLHFPEIKISTETKKLLQILSENYPLYLVTDGNKIVQSRKVRALNIAHFFKKVFVTHRFGLKASKPSLICFEKIKEGERVEWKDLVYIGDDLTKDFVGLNRVGGQTVRIYHGDQKDLKLDSSYNAQYNIEHLNELLNLIPKIENKVFH
ncbi:MAG: HAD family hydrolase [Cyclobacteriaceae bacterium]